MQPLRDTITRTCGVCRKRHFFLAVTQDGFCKWCETQILPDLHNRTRQINDTIRRLNAVAQSPMQIGLIDSIIQNARVLAKFEASGLAFKPSPKSILSKYRLLKQRIIVRQIARDFDKLKQAVRARSSETGVVEARKLMSRISAAKKTTSSGRAELVQFEKRLQKFIRSWRHHSIDIAPVPETGEKETATRTVPKANGKKHGVRSEWRHMLQSFGISDADFQSMRRSLASIGGWQPKELDIVWELLDALERQESQAQKPNFRLLRRIYYSMALLACEAQRPYLDFLVESHRMLLLSYKQRRNVNRVQLLTVGREDCRSCQKYDRKIVSLEEALRRMPIPCQKCPLKTGESGNPSFTCTYVASGPTS